MKRLFSLLGTCIIALCLLAAPAHADTWTLYLGENDNKATLVTTGQHSGLMDTNGVSVMFVGGEGIARESGVSYIGGLQQKVGSSWALQVVDIDHPSAGKTTPISLYYRESLINDSDHWNGGTTTVVFSHVTLESGVSRTVYQVYPIGLGYIQYLLEVHGSPLSGASMIFRVYNEFN